ncbi:imidazolonepropionase, partial [Algoriphagus sp. AGSA1]|nr:imidazolonepropionase [Algoriphagus sp. AGSA1]
MTSNVQPEWDDLWINVHLATLVSGEGYGEIRNGAIATKNGRIVWLGKQSELLEKVQVKRQHDGQGCWLTPGLIDCHTHIVYAGNRSNEFEARLNGVPYEEIARQGGGIVSTVHATRKATETELFEASLPRVQALLNEGVTTLEIKSGYGLDTETEAKMLSVARRIGMQCPVRVKTTFLGAHAVPPEFK